MEIRDLLTEKRLHNLDKMVAEIDVFELKAKIERGEIFKLIEISNPDDFKKSRIAEAIHVPLTALEETALNKFRKFQQVVIYCQMSDSSVGFAAVRLLQQSGFSNVLLLNGGKEAWLNAGFPLAEDTTKSQSIHD